MRIEFASGRRRIRTSETPDPALTRFPRWNRNARMLRPCQLVLVNLRRGREKSDRRHYAHFAVWFDSDYTAAEIQEQLAQASLVS